MTVSCPKCGRNNPDEAYICQFCDSPLVIYQAPQIPPMEPPHTDNVEPVNQSNPTENPASEPPESGSPEWLELLRKKKEQDAQKLGEDFFNRFGPMPSQTNEPEAPTDGEEWLHRLPMSDLPASSPPLEEESTPPVQAGPPEWLSSIRNKITEETPQPEEVHTDSGEDWLNKLRKQTEELHTPQEGLPAWAEPSHEVESVTSPSPFVEEPAAESLDEFPIDEPRQPVLFDDLRGEPDLSSIESYSEPIEEEPDHPIPEQLRNSIPQMDSYQLSEDILPPEEELLKMKDEPREKISGREIPNWLTAILGENEAEATAMSAVDALQSDSGEVGSVQPGALPGWVQAMRPTEISSPMKSAAIEAEKNLEKSGPLAGIRGILPGETAIPAYTKTVDYHVGLENRQKREDHVQAFQEILTAETTEVKVPGYRRTRAAGTVRWIIMVLLFFIMLTSVVGSSKPVYLPTSMPRETIQLFQSIVSLQPGDKILVAIDYEPAYAGEIEAVASPVMNHLMVKQAEIYVVSTNPAGAALAQKMIDNIGLFPQTSHEPYLSGEKFHLVGYLPGGQAGIQALNTGLARAIPLTQDLKPTTELPGISGLTNLTEFKALLILSDQPDTVRSWLEQIKQTEGVPALWAVVSAQAVPMLRPYVRSGQLKGLAAGEYGGSLYERIFQQPGLAWSQWNAYHTGLLAALILIIIGGVLNFTGQLILQARRKKAP